MPKKIIFLDRDGVINEDTGYVYKKNDFVFKEGIFELLTSLKNDYEFIIITNQSGIGRGFYTENDYQKLTAWMRMEFLRKDIHFLEILHCPHTPEESCQCRKPKPTLITKTKLKYNIDKENSWLIGDKASDIECAKNAGIKNRIFLTSERYEMPREEFGFFVVGSLAEANNKIKQMTTIGII